jgi:nucleotide-binding universal stress UspA family protein
VWANKIHDDLGWCTVPAAPSREGAHMTASDVAPVQSKTDIGRIIVACDGIPTDWAALAWAEADCIAGHAGKRLIVCRTYSTHTAGPLRRTPVDIASLELVDPEFAREIHQIRDRIGGEQVDVVLGVGDVADQVVALAEPGDVVVAAAPMAHGSGSAVTLGAHSGTTVVAVRPTATRTDVAAPFAGHVVVGVDGGARDAGPIGFAFDYAARHGKPVIAVHAHESEPAGLWTDDTFMELHPMGHEFGLEMLDAAIAGAHADHPGVPVRRAVMRQRAGAALVHASDGAALLVVGDRGHRALARHLLGSVSRHVLMHAHCTVAVIHSGSRA